MRYTEQCTHMHTHIVRVISKDQFPWVTNPVSLDVPISTFLFFFVSFSVGAG